MHAGEKLGNHTIRLRLTISPFTPNGGYKLTLTATDILTDRVTVEVLVYLGTPACTTIAYCQCY